MARNMWTFLRNHAKRLSVLWLVLITVLFFLPGAALPKENWLDQISFDKWVHVGFFVILVFLSRFWFDEKVQASWFLFAAVILYGLVVEVIQHYFVVNRSFDLGDLIADAIGAAVGMWGWRCYKKNRPL